MMPALQYLRHGKALCGKVFKRFVETFNYHNDFIANLKGDGDLPMSDGCILLDLTDPKHPVIRFNKQKLDLPEGEPAKIPGCFEIRAPKTNGDSDGGGFDNPYYMVGSRIYAAGLGDYPDVATPETRKNRIFALMVGLTGSSPSASITTATSFSELQAAAGSDDYAVYPLYEFGPNGEIKCDMRNIPTVTAREWMA